MTFAYSNVSSPVNGFFDFSDFEFPMMVISTSTAASVTSADSSYPLVESVSASDYAHQVSRSFVPQMYPTQVNRKGTQRHGMSRE